MSILGFVALAVVFVLPLSLHYGPHLARGSEFYTYDFRHQIHLHNGMASQKYSQNESTSEIYLFTLHVCGMRLKFAFIVGQQPLVVVTEMCSQLKTGKFCVGWLDHAETYRNICLNYIFTRIKDCKEDASLPCNSLLLQ